MPYEYNSYNANSLALYKYTLVSSGHFLTGSAKLELIEIAYYTSIFQSPIHTKLSLNCRAVLR